MTKSNTRKCGKLENFSNILSPGYERNSTDSETISELIKSRWKNNENKFKNEAILKSLNTSCPIISRIIKKPKSNLNSNSNSNSNQKLILASNNVRNVPSSLRRNIVNYNEINPNSNQRVHTSASASHLNLSNETRPSETSENASNCTSNKSSEQSQKQYMNNINQLLRQMNDFSIENGSLPASIREVSAMYNVLQQLINTAIVAEQQQQKKQQEQQKQMILATLVKLMTSAPNEQTMLLVKTLSAIIGRNSQPKRTASETNITRYKTELCRSFEETGECKYGKKCQFAHGNEELRRCQRHPKYKTELCRSYHNNGYCPYGIRCHFIHYIDENRSDQVKPSASTLSCPSGLMECTLNKNTTKLEINIDNSNKLNSSSTIEQPESNSCDNDDSNLINLNTSNIDLIDAVPLFDPSLQDTENNLENSLATIINSDSLKSYTDNL